MTYSVEFTPEAKDDLAKLQDYVVQRILSRIQWLAINCDLIHHKPLSGELSGLFKLRVGDYRVAYSFDLNLKLITIHLIGHRKDVYK